MVRDLWPRLMGRPIREQAEENTFADWELVPESFSGVCEWAQVILAEEDNSLGMQHRLVYKHRDGKELFEVCVRAQGFVKCQSIGPLGNWNG